MQTIERLTIEQYNEAVLDYLEYLGYDEIILDFQPQCIAESLLRCVLVMYHGGYSHRMCALLAYGATMTYQVIPLAKELAQNRKVN